MDVNLSKKKVAGFLGQSYVLIPRKVLEMLFHGKGRDRSVGMVYLPCSRKCFSRTDRFILIIVVILANAGNTSGYVKTSLKVAR